MSRLAKWAISLNCVAIITLTVVLVKQIQYDAPGWILTVIYFFLAANISSLIINVSLQYAKQDRSTLIDVYHDDMREEN